MGLLRRSPSSLNSYKKCSIGTMIRESVGIGTATVGFAPLFVPDDGTLPPHPSRGAVGSDRAFPTPGRPVPTDQIPEVQQGLVPLDIGSLGSGQFMRGKPEPPVRLPGNLAQHPAGDSPCVGVYQYAGPAKGEAEDSGGYVVPHPGMATSCCQLSGQPIPDAPRRGHQIVSAPAEPQHGKRRLQWWVLCYLRLAVVLRWGPDVRFWRLFVLLRVTFVSLWVGFDALWDTRLSAKSGADNSGAGGRLRMVDDYGRVELPGLARGKCQQGQSGNPQSEQLHCPTFLDNGAVLVYNVSQLSIHEWDIIELVIWLICNVIRTIRQGDIA